MVYVIHFQFLSFSGQKLNMDVDLCHVLYFFSLFLFIKLILVGCFGCMFYIIHVQCLIRSLLLPVRHHIITSMYVKMLLIR